MADYQVISYQLGYQITIYTKVLLCPSEHLTEAAEVYLEI